MPAIETEQGAVFVLAKKSAGFWPRLKSTFRMLPLFAVKTEVAMDPIAAIFIFLNSPEGQKLVAPLVQVETDMIKILAALIRKATGQITP